MHRSSLLLLTMLGRAQQSGLSGLGTLPAAARQRVVAAAPAAATAARPPAAAAAAATPIPTAARAGQQQQQQPLFPTTTTTILTTMMARQQQQVVTRLPNPLPSVILPSSPPIREHDSNDNDADEDSSPPAPSLECIKRTFQPSLKKRKRTHGFLQRLRGAGGRRVLGQRRAKGRWRLAV